MKWSKYQEHMTDPRLGHCLNWHVSAWSSGDALRGYVERIVKYIAVRPWENLDLQSGDSGDGVIFVTYYVHYHITNDDQRGHYIRTTHDMGGEESEEEATPTIASIYESIKWWHRSYWAKQPGEHKIVIDAVVREQKVWSDTLLDFESYDIYLPPENFTI